MNKCHVGLLECLIMDKVLDNEAFSRTIAYRSHLDYELVNFTLC